MTSKPWKPKEGEKYWFLYGCIDSFSSSLRVGEIVCNGVFPESNLLPCFPTKHSAELALRKIQKILGVK